MDGVTRHRHWAVALALVGLMLTGTATRARAYDDDGARIEHRHGHESTYNDQYIFATTRAVNEMDMNPAFKITLIPVTLVLDTVFLPFALIAGFFG